MAKNEGKVLESCIENSAKEQSIFYFRVRDVNPMALKKNFSTPKNKFDCLMHYKGYLFPIELKSTKAKSISMKESMIKSFQIKSLTEASTYENVIPGFIMNFREPENKAYFIHIKDFVKYKNIAENKLEHDYKSKINISSIPLSICEEVGIEITNVKKQINYRYYLKKLFDEVIERFGDK